MESIKDINIKELTLKQRRGYFPSPVSWSDEVLYFLLVDRFSTGNETTLYTHADNGNAIQTAASQELWKNAGNKFCGGKIKGITSKLRYLKNLGVSAIWVSPIFKQVKSLETYHGYGIQNFLEIEPRFGTKDDLKELVAKAHSMGIYIVLDIILNHSGNVWEYSTNPAYWDDKTHEVAGFYDKNRRINPISSIEDGIWPGEFQNISEIFTRKGQIKNWDYDPEYKEGDFCDLKDINIGSDNLSQFVPTKALLALCEIYKYWIAYADIDGYRIDTVKHMGQAATRFFCREIREFAQSIGKQNFYQIGEITGGRINAFNTVEITGLNAALGIDDVQDKLEYLVKGYRNPEDYFYLFGNSKELNKDSHAWFGEHVVTMIDDHDQVRKGENKARFCANDNGDKLIYCALALNLTTLGIPCIYYGTEQYFDGKGGSDEYIRECMFGGDFGAFRSKGVHFFNNSNPLYREISRLIEFRKRKLALKRGRQYLRQISGDGYNFGYPAMQGGRMVSIVAWSRIFSNEELVCAINNSIDQVLTAWVTVDNRMHNIGDTFVCSFSSDEARQAIILSSVESRNGKAIYISVPPGGFAVFEKQR
ncbi:MAG: alpha-amylase family glycosyl hydrolase [Bacteroidales bacterium]